MTNFYNVTLEGGGETYLCSDWSVQSNIQGDINLKKGFMSLLARECQNQSWLDFWQ